MAFWAILAGTTVMASSCGYAMYGMPVETDWNTWDLSDPGIEAEDMPLDIPPDEDVLGDLLPDPETDESTDEEELDVEDEE
jgi:hypothetical protein